MLTRQTIDRSQRGETNGRIENRAMFQKDDGRKWNIIKCNGVDVEMLWDLDASNNEQKQLD